MANRIPAVDNSSYQMPDPVRARLALNLADDAEVEGAAIGAKFVRKGELVHNVLDYGAMGDGLTDDTAAIQAASDAAELTQGTVYFPPLDYYIQTGVIIRDGVTYSGYGARIIKLGAGDWITAFYTLSIRGTGYGAGASEWRIEGFKFVGIPDTKTCVISMHHAQDYQIVDCTFTDAQGSLHCIDMQGCRRGLIERCLFQGYEPVVGDVDKEAIQIDHSYRAGGPLLPESSANYSRYDGLGCRDITVRNCTAVRSPTKDAPNIVGAHSQVDANYHRRIRIENNYIEVSIAQHTDPNSRRGSIFLMCVQDVIITGNVFQCLASATQNAIRVRGNTTGFASDQWQTTSPVSTTLANPMNPSNITIRDNTFLDFNNNATGILVHMMGVNDTVNGTHLEGVAFVGNTFKGCLAPGGGTNGVTLTTFERSRNVCFQGNTADGSRQFVYAEFCRNLDIVGNTGRQSTFVTFRINATAGAVISGNMLDGSDEFVLIEAASTNTQIVGNTFINKTGTSRTDAIMIRGASVGFMVSNNIIRGGTGTMTYGIRAEGTSTAGIASANLISTGYGTATSTEAGSAMTVTGTVSA